jgi:cell division septation protein DedD
MKRVLLIAAQLAAAAVILLAAGCMSAVRPSPGAAGNQRAEPGDPRERYTASGGQTFLDTLNLGKEIALSASDLPAIEVVPATSAGKQQASAGGAEEHFRIQILASSQVDMARKEKVNAETALKHPVFMVSEQSLYKLYVGDFKTKAEAEAALPDVRQKGYKDAWIVSTKPNRN